MLPISYAQVSSDFGADGRGAWLSSTGSLYRDSYLMSYAVYQVYNTTSPTVCEVYYSISNPVSYRHNKLINIFNYWTK